MDDKNFGISFNTMFQYAGTQCACAVDVTNDDPNLEPQYTLKICPTPNKRLLFSYAPREGLNVTGIAGGTHEKNILGKLLALPKDDLNAIIEFIEKYGFLFPLPEGEYTAVDASTLNVIINRIKSTIRLRNRINKKDYKGILINAVYLLFSPRVDYKIGNTVHSTCSHRFSELLEMRCTPLDLSRAPEAATLGTYSVNDSFLGKKNPIDISFYNAVNQGADTDINGSKDPFFKWLMPMYVGCQDENEDTRYLIDFFYHFQTEISVIRDVHFGGFNTYTNFSEDDFSDSFKNGLLKIAKIVLAAEINHNISGIHPKYNGGRLSADWQIDTLLEALYFSIFYMSSEKIYKECGNPNCKRDKYFLVDATRSNKVYCCPQCRNAASAQRFRQSKL